MSALPKYALVQWVGNEDDGKFTIILTSYIKNFNLVEFKNNRDETFVVEWRDQKKAPIGGWRCYDAVVKEISDSKAALERRLAKLVRQSCFVGSPCGTSVPEFDTSSVDDTDEDKSYEPSDKSIKKSRKEIADDVTPTKKSKKQSKGDKQKKCLNRLFSPVKSGTSFEPDPVFPDPVLEVEDRRCTGKCVEEIRNLRKENDNLKTLLCQKVPDLLEKFGTLMDKYQDQGSSSAPDQNPAPSQQRGKVEVTPGSNVFVNVEAWLSAKSCQTPGAFIGRLLTNLFEKEVLLNSNLKGGASKTNPEAEKRKPLDPQKIAALKGAAMSLFPALKESQFGTYVNQKITNMRSAEKKSQL